MTRGVLQVRYLEAGDRVLVRNTEEDRCAVMLYYCTVLYCTVLYCTGTPSCCRATPSSASSSSGRWGPELYIYSHMSHIYFDPLFRNKE